MNPLFIGLLAAATILAVLWPGPVPGSPTPLSRLYERLKVKPAEERDRHRRVPWMRKLPLRPLVALLQRVMSPRYRGQAIRLLRIAGLDLRYGDLLAMKAALAVACLFYFLLMFGKARNPAQAMALLAVGLPVAFFYPDVWLRSRAERRQEEIRRQLPAVLSALAVALESGIHLMAAIGEVCRDRQGALVEELRTAVEWHERGRGVADSLEAITREVEVPELTMVLAGLVQAFAKGSSHVVAEVREQAGEAWRARKSRAERLAQTASVKLFLPIALLALPGFLIFLMGPAVLKILRFFHA